MEISSINFNQNILSKTNELSKNKAATNISFQGNLDDKNNIPASEHCAIFYHPVFELQKQLIQDGYSIDEIRNNCIFDVIEIKDFDYSNPNLENDIDEGKITKNDIFSHSPKKLADIKAIQKAYTLLKQKFVTPEVEEHIIEMNEFETQLESFFEKHGKNLSHKTTYQSMILRVLRHVDKNNVELLEKLLNDENFSNLYLADALMKLDKDKDMKYAYKTLELAQEKGYKKEFSFALATILSEAEKENMPIIEKMLTEQEFLIENENFVSSKLMSFLRMTELELAWAYLTIDNKSLEEVDKLMD